MNWTEGKHVQNRSIDKINRTNATVSPGRRIWRNKDVRYIIYYLIRFFTHKPNDICILDITHMK